MVMRLCWCPQSTVRALMRLRTGWGVTPGFGMIGIKSMNYRSSHAASSPSSWSRQGPTAHTLHWTKCIHLSIHSLWLYMRHLSPHRINYDKTLGSDSHNHNLYCTVRFLGCFRRLWLYNAMSDDRVCQVNGRTFVYAVCGSTEYNTFAVNIVQIVRPAMWKSNRNQQRYNIGDMRYDHHSTEAPWQMAGGDIGAWTWPFPEL